MKIIFNQGTKKQWSIEDTRLIDTKRNMISLQFIDDVQLDEGLFTTGCIKVKCQGDWISLPVDKKEIEKAKEAIEQIKNPKVAWKKCSKCGTVIYEGDLFCGGCGCPTLEEESFEIKDDDRRVSLSYSRTSDKAVEKEKTSNLEKVARGGLDPNVVLEALIEAEGNKYAAAKNLKQCCDIDSAEIMEALTHVSGLYCSELVDSATMGRLNALSEEHSIEKEKDACSDNKLEKKKEEKKHWYDYSGPEVEKTIIVGDDSRKKVVSTVARGAVGGFILGPVGLLAAASGKNKHKVTFFVKYKDGTSETRTVDQGSIAYEEFCKHLDG